LPQGRRRFVFFFRHPLPERGSSLVIFGTRGLGNSGFRGTPSTGIQMVEDLLTAAHVHVSQWY